MCVPDEWDAHHRSLTFSFVCACVCVGRSHQRAFDARSIVTNFSKLNRHFRATQRMLCERDIDRQERWLTHEHSNANCEKSFLSENSIQWWLSNREKCEKASLRRAKDICFQSKIKRFTSTKQANDVCAQWPDPTKLTGPTSTRMQTDFYILFTHNLRSGVACAATV